MEFRLTMVHKEATLHDALTGRLHVDCQLHIDSGVSMLLNARQHFSDAGGEVSRPCRDRCGVAAG
jgi:hypothetical protein